DAAHSAARQDLSGIVGVPAARLSHDPGCFEELSASKVIAKSLHARTARGIPRLALIPPKPLVEVCLAERPCLFARKLFASHALGCPECRADCKRCDNQERSENFHHI